MFRGMRFKKARAMDDQVYQVTAVRKGYVYYRPVYQIGFCEELGAVEDCTVEQFHRFARPDRSVPHAV